LTLIHLIRHGHAGHRSQWEGDDALRPLDDRGEAEARAIADALADAGIDRLWSSHFVRCRQTVQPLADKLGLKITDHSELAEGGHGADALAALLHAAEAGKTVGACSHGDVIPAVVAAAVRRGAVLDGPPSPSKGARYELAVEKGAVTRITHVPRPKT
jgi:phosphohistidine phosphatase SixA